jgi:hypothetical protein
MKKCLGLIFLLASATACTTTSLPIQPGNYRFQHHFAEQPTIPSITVDVKIDGRHITVTNKGKTDAFPHGVLAEGTLMWHPASGQWIIGNTPEDTDLADVGGCSEGPEVVDLKNHVFWTC